MPGGCCGDDSSFTLAGEYAGSSPTGPPRLLLLARVVLAVVVAGVVVVLLLALALALALVLA